MSRSNVYKITSRTILSVIVLAFSMVVAAETVKIEGVIKARAGDEMIVAVNELAEQAFLLTDEGKVEQVGGLFKAQQDKDVNGCPHSRPQSQGRRNLQRPTAARCHLSQVQWR